MVMGMLQRCDAMQCTLDGAFEVVPNYVLSLFPCREKNMALAGLLSSWT